MTSRYSLTSPPEVVAAYFGLGPIEPFPPRPAIAPTEPVIIVRRGLREGREAMLVRWGLIPGWMKDPTGMTTLFAARAETASEKPSFRGGMRHRRCLVPADGFYGWSGEKSARRAHLFQRAGGGLLALAGIWEHWIGADGSEIDTMAVLTVEASADVAPFVDRMPLILEPEQFESWLDCRSGEAVTVKPLLVTPRGGLLEDVGVDGPLPRARLQGLD